MRVFSDTFFRPQDVVEPVQPQAERPKVMTRGVSLRVGSALSLAALVVFAQPDFVAPPVLIPQIQAHSGQSGPPEVARRESSELAKWATKLWNSQRAEPTRKAELGDLLERISASITSS